MKTRVYTVGALCMLLALASCDATSRTRPARTNNVTIEPTVSKVSLATHQWKHRVLIVFAAHDEQDLVRHAQESMIKQDPTGFHTRHMRVYVINQHPTQATLWTPTTTGWEIKTVQLQHSTKQWRRTQGVTDDKTHVVLVGKDGDQKLKTRDAILTTTKLYATIDAMPMRQNEMKQRAQKK